jgi:N-acetyl-anhydromuramyl-L-alanine amidase AmpD
MPQAVVVHTTGSGILVAALKEGRDPLAYAAAYYARPDSFTSGYLVGHEGEVVGLVPDNLIACHAGVGQGRAALYARGQAHWTRLAGGADGAWSEDPKHEGRYRDWVARWPGLTSPRALLDGYDLGVNARTLSLDLLAPVPGEAHPEAQLRAAADLAFDLLLRHRHEPPTKRTVLRHSDLDPLVRSTAAGGWDPPRAAFVRLCDLLGFAAW